MDSKYRRRRKYTFYYMGRPEGALRDLGIAIRYGVAELLTGLPLVSTGDPKT